MAADVALRAQLLASAPLSGRGAAAEAAAIVIVLAGALALDGAGTWWTQTLGSAITWCLLLVLLRRQTPVWRLTLVVATAFALLAEVLFSLGWGLYDYRLQNIPGYVPPGHTLLFMLGVGVSRHLADRLVTPLLLTLAAGGVLLTLSGISRFDGLLLAILLLVLRHASQRKVYVLMLLIALALELAGTSVGAWAWRPLTPGLDLSVHNPPLLAGVFYALFDVYVMATARRFHRLLKLKQHARAVSFVHDK